MDAWEAMRVGARETMLRLRWAADELQQLYEIRGRTYDMLTNANARLSPTGVRARGDVHRLDVLGELTDRVDQAIMELAGLRAQALDMIGRLSDGRQRAVLMAYYVNCRRADGATVTWDDVAGALHMSRRQVTRIHADAIQALDVVEKMSLNVPRRA